MSIFTHVQDMTDDELPGELRQHLQDMEFLARRYHAIYQRLHPNLQTRTATARATADMIDTLRLLDAELSRTK